MNSKNYLTTLLTVPAIALGTTLFLSQGSHAEETVNIQVVCNVIGETPTVIVQGFEEGSNEQVTLLRFITKYFESPEMARSACESTAQKLHELYSKNKANYLIVDNSDIQPVVCVVSDRSSGCNSFEAEFLFKFEPVAGEDSFTAYDYMLGDTFEPPDDFRTIGKIYTNIQPRHWWETWLR